MTTDFPSHTNGINVAGEVDFFSPWSQGLRAGPQIKRYHDVLTGGHFKVLERISASQKEGKGVRTRRGWDPSRPNLSHGRRSLLER